MASFYLTREEDGTSKYRLEDASGFILLETALVTPGTTRHGAMHRLRLEQKQALMKDEYLRDEEEALVLLTLGEG